MAEKAPAKEAAAPAGTGAAAAKPSAKGKLPVKTAAILGIAFVLEAVVIAGVFMFAGKPTDVKADAAAADAAAAAEEPVEIQVIADKFQNTRTGRTYLYDTEVFVLVKMKNQEQVNKELEAKKAQTATDIATIFRRAEPAYMLEPTLATLTRQVHAALDERVGKDEQGKSLIEQVLIKKCTQYRADF